MAANLQPRAGQAKKIRGALGFIEEAEQKLMEP